MWPFERFRRPTDTDRLAARLHWVFWVGSGWKPGKGQTCESVWRARDEKTKLAWRSVAEESRLPEHLL